MCMVLVSISLQCLFYMWYICCCAPLLNFSFLLHSGDVVCDYEFSGSLLPDLLNLNTRSQLSQSQTTLLAINLEHALKKHCQRASDQTAYHANSQDL